MGEPRPGPCCSGGLGRVVDRGRHRRRQARRWPKHSTRRRVINQAIWEVQQARATWTRHDLIAALNRELPDCLGGLSADQTESLLGELADQALSPGGEVVRLTRPRAGARARPSCAEPTDGPSTSHPKPTATRRRGTCAPRSRCVAAARSLDGPKVEPEVAERLVESSRCRPSQGAAVLQLLTSGREVEPMIGYAGAGKTFTMAELARLWSEATGTPALGLTTAERARQVLAEEGFETSANIARWLGAQRRIEAGRALPGDRAVPPRARPAGRDRRGLDGDHGRYGRHRRDRPAAPAPRSS